MREKEVLQLAEELAKKRAVDPLKLLVRAAALPLMAEGMLAWTEGDPTLPRFLQDAIPSEVARLMGFHQVAARYGQPKAITLDLSRDTVLSFPWNRDRLGRALEWISTRPWQYDSLNHEAYYFRPIGVGVFFNGLHSGAVGILKREGQLPATEVDLTPLYAAGFRVEWRKEGLFRGEEKPFAVFHNLAKPMEHPHHALLLALGEVLHRHGLSL